VIRYAAPRGLLFWTLGRRTKKVRGIEKESMSEGVQKENTSMLMLMFSEMK